MTLTVQQLNDKTVIWRDEVGATVQVWYADDEITADNLAAQDAIVQAAFVGDSVADIEQTIAAPVKRNRLVKPVIANENDYQ